MKEKANYPKKKKNNNNNKKKIEFFLAFLAEGKNCKLLIEETLLPSLDECDTREFLKRMEKTNVVLNETTRHQN